MVTRFGKHGRTFLAGSLVFAAAVAVSVVGGSVPASPAAAATPSPWTAYVVSYNDSAVIPVNTATDAVGAPITVGNGPSAIAITPRGTTAYVTNEGFTNTAPGSVTPITLSTNTPGTPIPVGSGPDAIAITPNGLTAYVGNYNDDTVTPINLLTNTAGPPIAVGAPPTAITITPDGSTAYVTLGFDDVDVPIDTATNTAGPSILNTTDGFASAITPDGVTLYTPNFRDNGVATLDPATDARGSITVLDDPEGVAITPDGSSAYVTYLNFLNDKWSLVPIPTATNTPGTPIALGSSSAEGIAITPDGSTAFVTDPSGGTVVPVNLASGTADTPIPLGSKGTNPIAIAITPDQAPVAHLHVTLAPNGSPSTFDASASTVAYGTIASYHWNFGDGATETTTTPVTTHTYTGGSYTASVTETSSAGTSTTEVFTGQTASQNGGPQATATALGSVAGGGPIVAGVSPEIGSTGGATVVTITGSGFTGETGVDVGGQAATNVVFNSDSSLTATLPAQSAGADDVIVTTPIGSSATTPADQFTYLAPPAAPVDTTCATNDCAIPVLQFPVGFGETTVSSTVSSDCNACTLETAETESEGLPPVCDGAGGGCCPDGMSYDQAQISVGEYDNQFSSPLDVVTEQIVQGQAAYAEGLPFPPPPVPQTTVCAEAQALSGGSSDRSSTGRKAAPAGGLGQNIVLKKCARRAVAPCVKSVVVTGRTVVTTVILPVNETVDLTVGPQKETVKKFSPKVGAPGSNLSIKGTNLTEVNAVTIGGVQASIVSETAKKLEVTVPPGATTGLVTLTGWSGDVTSRSAFRVT